MTKPKVALKRLRRKRPGGKGHREVWMLRWPDGKGRVLAETIGDCRTMTKTEAQALRRDKQGKLDNRLIRADRPEKMTLAQFVERDKATIAADVKPTTLIEYRIAADHAIAAIGGNTRLTAIGRPEVAKVKAWLAAPHKINDGKQRPASSKATIKKVLVAIKAMFRRALDEGLVYSNPFEKPFGNRPPKIQAKQKRIFTREEVALMLEVESDLWWQALIEVAVTSGLRKSEMLNLQWRDVDLDKGTVTVAAKRAGKFKANGQTYPVLPWDAKDYDERTVPLPPATVALLQRLKLKAGGSQYVFLGLDRLAEIQPHVRSDGSLPAKFDLRPSLLWEFKAIQRRSRALLAERRKVKLEEVDWPLGTLHDLRKTFGTWAASNGVAMHELRVYMGHSDIATTAKHYLGVSDDAAEKVRKAVSA